MADASGQADIRGIDIDKLAKGFADEENVFKKICTVTPTKAREIRFYRKTSGFLDSTDTTAITASQIANTSERSRPVVVEQTWTRVTKYARKYFVESPTISMEDIRDADIDILATNVRDLVRAVARQVDKRIYDVLTADNGNTNATTAAWDAASGQDPIEDILEAKQNIRDDGYNPEGAYLLLSPKDHKSLMVWLISTKGASIPAFASQHVKDGVVMEILGLRVLVSTNVDADEAAVVVPQRCMTWKTFTPLTSAVIDDPGIGKKIRVWEEGEAIMTDTNACNIITNTATS
jgi:hypothetical protein